MKITSLIVKLIIIININITLIIAQPTIIRCCHGSTVANNKLYVGGGLTGSENEDIYTDDFFSLDLTKPFSTSSPDNMPYEVLANVPIKSNTHTLVYANNDKGGMRIYLFGGHRDVVQGQAIYSYDLEEKAWTSITPNIRNKDVPIPVGSTTKIVGVTDSSFNNVYIFDNRTMFIYDGSNNYWDAVGILAPYDLIYYAAVMLNTGEIAYIGGGYFGTTNVPMEQILIYNTQLSYWYIKTAKSANIQMPSSRQGHTASIAPDGRIFVYGGFDGNEYEATQSESDPTFAVLEYVNGEFVWSSPQLFNQTSAMRIYHTSHVVGNYLIIAFGRNLTRHRLNRIDFIDISNRDSYKVVTNFIPADFTSSKSASSKTIIIATIASVFGIVGSIIIIYFVYVKRDKVVGCIRHVKLKKKNPHPSQHILSY